MPSERTLSIVKPDGVGRNLIGEVLRRFEQAGLKVVAARMLQHRTQLAGMDFPGIQRIDIAGRALDCRNERAPRAPIQAARGPRPRKEGVSP